MRISLAQLLERIVGRRNNFNYLRAANHYIIMQTATALEKIGFFRELERSPRSLREMARILDADEHLLDAAMEFLLNTTDLLEKKGDVIFLKEQRQRAVRHWPIWRLLVYKSMFGRMEELLRGKATFGRDITRDSSYYAQYSEVITGGAIGHVLRHMPADVDTLVDLGCGSARSLITFCGSDEKRRGIGIDIDRDVTNCARRNVEEAGLGDRIHIIEDDIARIERWKDQVAGDRPLFLSSGVIHEFLRDGEEPAIRFLENVRRAFPASRLVLIEAGAASLNKTVDDDILCATLVTTLIHRLSGQGLPQPPERWKQILHSAGWNIEAIEPFNYTLAIYRCSGA